MTARYGLRTAELDRMPAAAIARAADPALAATIAIVDAGRYAFRPYRAEGGSREQ